MIFKWDVSHAWVHLHRCVESLGRTTGENYSSIFTRVEKVFKFDRTNPQKLLDLQTIQKIAQHLKQERDFFLQELNKHIEVRINEKKKGLRFSSNEQFIKIIKQQQSYKPEKMRPFGWRENRKLKLINLDL